MADAANKTAGLISWPLVGYVLKGARHDKLIIAMVVMIGIAMAMSFFMGSASMVEKTEFAFIYMAGSLRILGVIGLSLFLVFFFRRAMDNKDVDYLLSRPISRATFLLSHALGFGILAFVVWILVFGPICYIGRYGMQNNMDGFLLWGAGYLAELLITTLVSFFFALILRSASVAAFACFAFYILCRLQGQLLGIITNKIDPGDHAQIFLANIMKSVSMFFPRLDLMGQTSWFLYGPQGANAGLGFIALQAGIFLALTFTAMMADFVRKQF
jgi:ABC-type transport system involved in multi-copper enzyme maturation permease subunit